MLYLFYPPKKYLFTAPPCLTQWSSHRWFSSSISAAAQRGRHQTEDQFASYNYLVSPSLFNDAVLTRRVSFVALEGVEVVKGASSSSA